jgi:preprotein translocase subunit YajC
VLRHYSRGQNQGYASEADLLAWAPSRAFEETIAMFISPAYAQATGPGGMGELFNLLIPMLMVFVIFYFFMIRPQQQRMKQHRAAIDSIRRGDTVVTSGGIVGKVTKVDDNELQVEIAEGVRIKVVRGTISEVRTKGEAPASPKAKAAADGDK